ncbi:MAG TPA: SRPBCC family protein [Rhizomicrobium sp.]|jgi:uncharacterized protein YndB with AHSA1/START domain
MKWLFIAVSTLVAIAAVVLLLASAKPGTVSVSRSIVIHAPAPTVFALIDDLHNWPLWAPQDREDATMKRDFGGAPRGVGAMSSWTSKGRSGTGQMIITQSIPDSRVDVTVDFHAPFVAHNTNRFVLERDGDGTHVTWSMQGTNIFILRLMSVFVSPDAILGSHFEKGLAALKSNAERSAKSQEKPAGGG